MTPTPPRAAQRPVELVRHGDVRIDPWFWLRDRDDPDVLAYLHAENDYAEAFLAASDPLREVLFDEIRARVQETDISPPVRKGAWEYFARTFEGSQYAVHGRRPAGSAEDEAEQILLDENELGRDLDYLSVGGLALSPDQSLLAYAYDRDGGERQTLRFRDLTTGAELPDVVDDVSYGLAWANDGRTIFYVRADAAMRPHEVRRYTLGTDTDVCVFAEADERFYVSVGRSRSGGVILISSESKRTSEMHLVDPDEPERPPRIVEPRTPGLEYTVDHHCDSTGRATLFIATNADGAENFKVMTAPAATPGRSQWVDFLGHRAEVKIDDVDVFRDAVVISERESGLEQLRVIDLTAATDGTGLQRLVAMPDPAYSTWVAENLEFDTDRFRFGYTSLATPISAYDETFATAERVLIKQTPVLGGFDPAHYTSARIWVRASDGTDVPHVGGPPPRHAGRRHRTCAALRVRKLRDHRLTRRSPSRRLSLLDRGFVFAIAHVRGGGEMGRTWYEQGRLDAQTEHLHGLRGLCRVPLRRGVSPRRPGSPPRGGSAGGLLMGAVMNLRPDLFRAVVAEVPFVDVVTTMQDAELPLTVTEWDEWGNPGDDPAVYAYMKSYSPYDNVTATQYPALLVTAGLNDPRVSYWEPAKWVAKLRATATGERPVLLRTELGAGHGGPSGRYDVWRDEAMVLAFLINELTGEMS